MDSSVYIALSRQMAQFDDMAMTSNNIANINTPGYNAQKLLFSEYLTNAGNGRKDAYANDPVSYRDLTGGPIKATGNPFDLAISGKGYFQVETQLGVRFTRAGNFQMDAQGTLVDISANPVLGADGARITIPLGARKIEINGIGQVVADGQPVGQIGVMEFENEQKLKRLGNALYSSDDAPRPSFTARITQGALEGSNINGVTEMVRVMELSRGVTNTAKFIEVMYDLQRKVSTTMSRPKPA